MAVDSKKRKERSIPKHENVIKNFVNIEIFHKNDEDEEDCLGWITIMEKCSTDLRCLLKEEKLGLEERKKIAIGVRHGIDYLAKLGIQHHDLKPENILVMGGTPKIIDFGVVMDASGRESYRQMGYTRRGSKFNYFYSLCKSLSKNSSIIFLVAGSPGFAQNHQLTGGHGDMSSNIFVFLFCDWKTTWTLLYRPVDETEYQELENMVKRTNADCIKRQDPKEYELSAISKIVSIDKSSSYLTLDDPNLTKSVQMSSLKQRATRAVNMDFQNLTNNVFDQKDSQLCVPITVCSLIRHALKDDLNFDDEHDNYSMEKLLTIFTMVIYPRSLAGLNLNPNAEEKDFQTSETDLLLRRLKNKTYLMESGWEIIRKMGHPNIPKSVFTYKTGYSFYNFRYLLRI